MKVSAIIIASIAMSAHAFVPMSSSFRSPLFGVVQSTANSVVPDKSELIEKALEASQKYGASSQEARLAWETVEEISASDNSEATKGSLDDACFAGGEMSAECMDYKVQLSALHDLVQKQGPIMESVRNMAADLKNIRLADPKVKSNPASPQLAEALAVAQRVTKEKGIDSADARVAWDNVEEIASAGRANAMGSKLTDECIVDAAMDACAALNELDRVLKESQSENSRFSK